MWSYSFLNVTHKKSYKKYEEKINDLLVAFICYVNDLNKLQHFKLIIQTSTSMHSDSLGNSTCSSTEGVLAFLLYECSNIHN